MLDGTLNITRWRHDGAFRETASLHPTGARNGRRLIVGATDWCRDAQPVEWTADAKAPALGSRTRRLANPFRGGMRRTGRHRLLVRLAGRAVIKMNIRHCVADLLRDGKSRGVWGSRTAERFAMPRATVRLARTAGLLCARLNRVDRYSVASLRSRSRMTTGSDSSVIPLLPHCTVENLGNELH